VFSVQCSGFRTKREASRVKGLECRLWGSRGSRKLDKMYREGLETQRTFQPPDRTTS
jgi:hypothetical protein